MVYTVYGEKKTQLLLTKFSQKIIKKGTRIDF